MIAASEPQEFVPFGRQQVLEHPGAVEIGIQEHNYHSENILSNRLSEVAITDSTKQSEFWILRETNQDATKCEEELYFKGKTVVWSIGPASTENRTNKTLKCCYTSESVVKQTFWCNFHLSTPDITSTFLSGSINKKNLPNGQKSNGRVNEDLKNCICILDANHIKFFTKSGKEYATTLQFEVLKIWAIKYGLIFERALEKKDNADNISDVKFKVSQETPITSPKNFKLPYSSNSRSLQKTFEQSVQDDKSNINLGEKSFGSSTQYLNIPSAIYGDFSPIAPSVPPPEVDTSELPVIFSLSHPLDEICPVVSKNENLSYISNPEVKVIFTSESPSLCMTYDRKSKLHSVWYIRKASPQESEICLQRESVLNKTSRCPTSFSTSGKACFPNSGNSSFNVQNTNMSIPAFLNARTRKSLGLSHTYFPNLVSSPFTSHEVAKHSSPISSVSALSPAFSHSHYSPSSRRGDSFSTPFGSASTCIENRMMTEDIEYSEPRPLYPQVCFQHLWTEPLSNDHGGCFSLSKEASKAFLSDDLICQTYLCYLIKTKNILNLLKLKKNNDDSCVIFGDVSTMNAKDACALTTLNMIAVIGLDGGVELYTGVVHVAKILISGVPSSVATSSYLSNSNAGPTFFSRSSLNSFPKRSSLLQQSATYLSPIFNESLSQLSPVTSLETSTNGNLTPNIANKTPVAFNPSTPSTPREGNLTALRDSAGSRISLEFSSGMIFRLELPGFGISPLVKNCLKVLQHVLPNELSLHLSVKWYCTRNVPGSLNVESDEEWTMFHDVLCGLIGYDMKLLKGMDLDNKKSPVIRAKKQKTSEQNCESDWNYLLESKHHDLFRNQVTNVLGFSFSSSEKVPSSESEFSAGISDTPNVSTRSSSDSKFDSLDSSRTPMDRCRYSKLKSLSSKIREKGNLESIDETPLQPKSCIGKVRQPSSRFQSFLDQDVTQSKPSSSEMDEDVSICKNGPLYSYLPQILFSLHLLYEDMKLNELKKPHLSLLGGLLHQLACDMNLKKYIHHYWLDFPNLCPVSNISKFSWSQISNIPQNFQTFVESPPNIFHHFYNMLLKRKVEPYPYMYQVNSRSKNLIQIIALLAYGYDCPGFAMETVIKNVSCSNGRFEKIPEKTKPFRARSHRPIPHRVVLLMTHLGITQDDMRTFPPGISLIIHEALYFCRDNPGFGWSKEAYKISMRHDLASFCRQNLKVEVGPTNELTMPSGSCGSKGNTLRLNTDLEEDGMEELANMDVLKLRFSTDQRVLEARRMLQSAQPVRITIQQRPDVSDHEFIQEQEKHLYAICTRTMALPVGRGMMTLRTSSPVITEKLPIPTLCLTGKVPPTDKVVDMSHIEVASNMNVWPLFHNGVAAGLRISPNAPKIDSEWIIYNKPKTNNDELIEHAGFLMALGLNGHLSNLLDTSIYRYLMKFHEMTSVGLLLGIAASKRGTMDTYTVKILSLHIEAMLPPTGIEIDVDVVVEPAALISLGFLYQGTAHRHIAHVLLQEIGRPPGPEMDNSIDRESYSLAAGLALGLVVFGRGAKLSGLGDMGIADTLHHYMVGGPKRPYLGSQREKYRTPSYLIWEGDLVNTHVTGPGAALALGMLFFNTGNKAIAEWLRAPETQHLLEMVLPDALLLRTLAKGLILWEEIEPSEEWVLSHVPSFARPYCLVKPQPNVDKDIDYETMNQGYCNIVAGACMAIGLRFAGSAYEDAFETLLLFAKRFTSLHGKSIAELCGRSTIETCLNVITVSLAMVMAGTGDIEVLRLCRYLRSRVGPTNTVVTYGSHLATHMAIGLLFLGGGAFTLSTSPESIAALLCAFYPKWPIHSNDNRYHLQALRHLYVLAVEPRLLLPRDIETRTLCYAHITCVYLDVPLYKGRIVKMRAPCLLPELNLLKEVRIEDSRYWSIIFTKGKNWKDFANILSESSFVDVKQRAGCLSYLEDPQGFRSLLAQTLTSDDVMPWTVPVETIFGFSSDPILVNFTRYFLESCDNNKSKEPEEKIVVWLTYIAYYCLTKDKLALLPIWVSLLKAGQDVFLGTSTMAIWQLKLMWAQALRPTGPVSTSALIPADMALSNKQYFHGLMDSWEKDLLPSLSAYFSGNQDLPSVNQTKLCIYLIFFDLLYQDNLQSVLGGRNISRYSFFEELNASAAMKMAQLMKSFQRVLQRGSWFPLYTLDRNFKGSCMNWRARWPEDDPLKPPLRLNIPKDAAFSPYQCDVQMSSKGPESTSKTDMFSLKWTRSTGLSPDTKYQYSNCNGCNDNDEKGKPLRRSQSNGALEDKRDSSEIPGNQNCLVKSESSESFKSSKNTREVRNNRRKREKNFKLKKIRSYEGVQFNSLPQQFEVEDKNDILTIQIALDDQVEEDDKSVKDLSGINTTEEAMTDDQISALAEAIANELKSKNGVESPIRTSDQKKNDEAYLVIINVTDNDNFENPTVGGDPSSTKSEDKVPWTAEAREILATQNLEGYGGNKQVRHLDITHELDQNVHSKKIARAGLPKKSKKTKNLYDLPIRPEPVFRYIVNGNSERGDMDLNRSSWDFFRSMGKDNRYSNTVDLLEEKEKRRETFEKSLRRARTVGHYCHSNRKKYERIRKKEEINVLSEVSKRIGRSFAERLTEPTRPIVYALEREGRTRTKITPENYLEKRTEPFGGDIFKIEEPCTTSLTLKPLSKQVRLIDELPELLRYPEYKYSVLRKPADDDRLRSRTVRSFHNSCINRCKLTEDKSSVIIMHGLDKTNSRSDSDKTLNAIHVTKGDRDASLSVKGDILRKEYSMGKLDNSLKTCSELSDNDIYLQESNVIGNIVTLTATNNVESSKNGIQSFEDVKTGCSKAEDECRGERYEPDITDFSLSQAMRFDGSYGMTLQVNKSAVEEDAKLKERNRIIDFGNLSWDKFEMNAECVREVGANRTSGKDMSVKESLLNSKKDAAVDVVKNEVTTPKISDNIANLANEEIAETDKGTANVDSLSMMKRVKEIVDLDLKNAEKIFNTSEPASIDHSLKTKENLQKLISLDELKSVVKHNEETNVFYVDLNELDTAKTRRQELADLRDKYLLPSSGTCIEKEGMSKEELKNDDPVYPYEQKVSKKYVLKSGESILVYDERTKEWKVDLTLLKDKPQKNRENDGTTEKLSTGKELKEDSPRERLGNAKNIGDTVSECSDEKDKNTPSAMKKPKKDAAKELDAQEIRKKNSDLYEDVFDIKKQTEVKKESELQQPKKKTECSEKNLPEHYVSKNIVEMSKNNSAEISKKLKSSKIETVKLNISSEKRPPSKVKEINLSQKPDDDRGAKENEAQKQGGEFYKDLEKYKTPFTDPEYEEKQLKINSDAKNNPNLKKLDSWNKTLVLQEMSKSNENVESWIKDETDKMATLLLRVLQEAAEGNSRRRTAAKTSGKGNPYEAIRKKQENGLTRTKKKEPGKKKMISMSMGKSGNKILGELAQNVMGGQMKKKGRIPAVGEEDFAEVAKEEFFFPKDALRRMGGSSGGKENTAEDIPGPLFLKKLSSLWRFLPELGCQASIFLTIGMFSMAKVFLSFLKSDINKGWNDPFGGLFKKYGPVVKIHGPLSGDVLLINRPEDISTVFTQSPTPRSVFDSLEHCRSQFKQRNFPVGITESCNGIDWDIVRQSTTDVSNKGCLHYFNMLKDTNTMLLNRIEKIMNKQKQVPDNFICELRNWSMEGLCGILFDKSIGFLEHKNSQVYWVSESERLLRSFHEATAALCQCESRFQLWRFLNTPAINGLCQAYQSLDLIISKYVYQAEISLRKKRKAVNSHKLNTTSTLSFLESVLLNDRMAPEDITASIIDVLLIGVNTTTTALGFLLYNLAQNNRVQRQLFKELKDLLPNKSSEISYHQLQSLKYLQACLKESMRVNVPIPLILRILPNDISIAEYVIPSGTHVVIDTQTACMKEQNFDEPERFRPERWLDQSCTHPFSSIPFSNGPREGLIKHMAEVHMLTCIAKIVRNYQIEYHFGEIKSTGRAISYPDKPLKLTFVERED